MTATEKLREMGFSPRQIRRVNRHAQWLGGFKKITDIDWCDYGLRLFNNDGEILETSIFKKTENGFEEKR